MTKTATSQRYNAIHGNQPTDLDHAYQSALAFSGPGPAARVAFAPSSLPPPVVPTGSDAPGLVNGSRQPVTTQVSVSLATGQSLVDSRSFINIAHSLWTVLVAFAGGITAQPLASGRKPANKSKGPENSIAPN